MTKKYTIHKGNIWGANNIDEDKIFKQIGLKEGQKMTLDEFSKKRYKWQDKIREILQNKLPKKKFIFSPLFYHGKQKIDDKIIQNEIYCDININPKPKDRKEFKKDIVFPNEIKITLQDYYQILRKKTQNNKKISSKTLEKIQKRFENHIKKNFSTIKQILLNDKDNNKRAKAALLLQWVPKEKLSQTKKLLFKSLNTELDHWTLSNAAFSLLQLNQQGVKLEPKPIFSLFQINSSICRNKAVWLLLKLFKQNKNIEIPSDVKKIIKKMSKCRQPNHREAANKLLKTIK